MMLLFMELILSLSRSVRVNPFPPLILLDRTIVKEGWDQYTSGVKERRIQLNAAYWERYTTRGKETAAETVAAASWNDKGIATNWREEEEVVVVEESPQNKNEIIRDEVVQQPVGSEYHQDNKEGVVQKQSNNSTDETKIREVVQQSQCSEYCPNVAAPNVMQSPPEGIMEEEVVLKTVQPQPACAVKNLPRDDVESFSILARLDQQPEYLLLLGLFAGILIAHLLWRPKQLQSSSSSSKHLLLLLHRRFDRLDQAMKLRVANAKVERLEQKLTHMQLLTAATASSNHRTPPIKSRHQQQHGDDITPELSTPIPTLISSESPTNLTPTQSTQSIISGSSGGIHHHHDHFSGGSSSNSTDQQRPDEEAFLRTILLNSKSDDDDEDNDSSINDDEVIMHLKKDETDDSVGLLVEDFQTELNAIHENLRTGNYQ